MEQEEASSPRNVMMPPVARPERHLGNTAHNSTVGIMASSVTGSSVHMNTAPQKPGAQNLFTAFNEFRESLTRHRTQGDLDEDTYREALADLESALRSARERTPDSAKRASMTLRRLRGLVADCPALLAELTPLIAAAGDRA